MVWARSSARPRARNTDPGTVTRQIPSNAAHANGTPGAANEEGLAVRFTFTEGRDRWRVTRAEYAPLLMVKDRTPMRLVDVARALADPALDPSLRGRLELARDRTAGVVGSRGAPARGLAAIAP